MRHVEKAFEKMKNNEVKEFIEIKNAKDKKGIAPIVKFTIQSDPIGEVGVNGCQATDMLEYVFWLFNSLNDSFPCEQNAETLAHIATAMDWQKKRTADRKMRGVEGANKA